MKRIALLALALSLLAAQPASAHRVPLTKRQAHAAGLKFVEPFVDMLDVTKPSIATYMDPPSMCERISRRTVGCYFWAYLEAERRIVSGNLRIHRQRDGLIGILLPWDPRKVMVRTSPTLVLGEPSGSDSVPEPVQVGVE
jgi:hypothetical protein